MCVDDKKVYLKCGYIYMKKGKQKSATYISSKESANLTNPNRIASQLANEILEETGRTVKSFIYIGKQPLK